MSAHLVAHVQGHISGVLRPRLIPTGGVVTNGGDSWSPLELFAASEDGFWLDPSDLSTVWQDTAGTVPAVVGDPVGRINDKSGNGNNAIQGTAANRPILRQDADGAYYLEFDGSNDSLVVTNAMGQDVFACTPVLMTAGNTKITYDGITAGHRMCLFRNTTRVWALANGTPTASRDMNQSVGVSKENVMVQYDGSTTRFDSTNGYTSGITFSTTDSPTGITIGAGFDGSLLPMAGRVYGAVFVCRIVTTDEREQVDAWVHSYVLKDLDYFSIVCDGNSLTQGTSVGAESSYPSQLLGLVGGGYRIVNTGIPSQQTAQMAARAPSVIDPLVAWPGGADLIAWENTNDIFFGANLATCQSQWNNYFSARQAAGWGSNGTRLVAMTTIPRGPFSAGQDAILADFNTWLRANYSTYATDLVDLAADARLSDPTNTTYFNADQIHLNSTGYGVVADLIKTALYP